MLTEFREPFSTMIDTKNVQPIGDGENRTLVLGKLRIDHYMLIVLIIASLYAERNTKTSLPYLISEIAPKGSGNKIHTK